MLVAADCVLILTAITNSNYIDRSQLLRCFYHIG